MSSYNLLNGAYTNENIHLMRDILRDDWKYDGVVVTDWGGSNDRVKGLIAGNSLEMPSTNGETNREIVEAVKNGILEESILDENLDRLLTLIFDTSLESKPEPFNIEEHHMFAEEVALESIVLLKNSNNALPLNSKEKVAIIGDFAKTPRYQGAGSSIVNPTKLDSALSVIGEFDINYIGFEPGFHRYGKDSMTLINRAVDLASQADTVILYLALDEYSEAEGMDRLHMSLPANQLKLLEQLTSLKKKIIVVLASGSPIEMDWENQVEAIVHSSLSGQAGARAILKIITGLANPSGKLSETYANKYEDYPSSNYFPGKEVNSLYKESIFVGYRYFDLNTKKVRYPFGYGLSYSKFKYSDLKIENSIVSFKIKNLSDIKGKEVSQLYVRAINSSIFRPYKELKGFSKVEVEPSQTTEVHIPLSESAFEFYNVDSGKWEIEDLDYEIIIGSSSQEIQLKTVIHMEGKKIKPSLTAKTIPSYFSGNVKNVDNNEFEKLLNREVPDSSLKYYKKNRILVDYNTPISDLRYAKGWTGRFLNWSINFIIKYYKFINKRDKANFIIMGIQHLPLRGIARMTAGKISHRQLDALIIMFNGSFFKGVKQFFKARKQKKQNLSK
jgi:beta-glucosidase